MARPTVTVYAEVSADGKSTHGRGRSSKPMMDFEDDLIRRFRHELRGRSDAIMVGSNTLRIDDPSLTVRHAEGRNPLRVIPSTMGNLPLESQIFNDGGATLIAVTEQAVPETVAALEGKAASVVRSGWNQVDLQLLLSILHERQIRSVMVEGGATLLSSLFRNKLVDHLIVQHLPVVFGGDTVPSMVGGPPLKSLNDAVRLRLTDTQSIGRHAVISYDVL